MGRPKLPPNERRITRTYRLFNRDEEAKVKRAARKAATSPNAYIRDAAVEKADKDLGLTTAASATGTAK